MDFIYVVYWFKQALGDGYSDLFFVLGGAPGFITVFYFLLSIKIMNGNGAG